MRGDGHQEVRHRTDVGGQRVARVYAEALLDAAEQHGAADAVADQLQSLVEDVFRADPKFEAFLASGAIGREHKERVLRSVFAGRASDLFLNFLLVVNAHERLELLPAVRDAFNDLRDKRARRVRVKVRSAVPLPDDQRDRLRQNLHDTFQMEPVLEAEVDPDLLGGLVVQVGDWLYDGSVRTQLETLRNHIIENSTHAIQSGRDRFSH